MSSADRKAKKKEELKALILEASMKLFVEKGIEQTTIRNIADAIDYSIGTVYIYFKDKNAIFHALHTQCFAELGVQFRVLYDLNDPMERLKAMGKLYIQYAMDNPDKYDLMFSLKAPMEFLNEIQANEWEEGTASFEVLRTTVQECIMAGHFKGHNLEPLSYLIWGCVHGLCSLEIRARTKGVLLKNPDTIVADGYDEFLKLLDKQ
ncbi:MAG: TetR family transcriptional regulator [Candidatus Fluviicola riflensis]|nr:MAG: TetR family transcriptional regulator [Candidatus Fluviicola riflensis]OGS79925.1 MAG: TetR family transcriptional regulator [Candidatus Fluviicola riflensis]OGS82440.1 MAG: TetR family transcriptional regulator [Fluviicola sp. RIFCSPHIGHO2_01_FULL_43_53]OGS88104.1 MAG: TetR family transcriptional regulator [Fluviicola sp. RIFCSPHIGHO2_12_FULL_43_24]